MSEKILFINRGDSFTLKFTPILANRAEKGILEAYSLRETDVLYFAIMPPTGTFEDALVLQAYTYADVESDNSFTIKIDRKSTCLLPAGIYYYTIKLATGVTDPAVAAFDINTDMTTILGRTKLIVSDGSLKATSGKFMTGMVPADDEVPDTPDVPEEPVDTPDVLFETYAEAELYAKTATSGKLVSVRDEKDHENIKVYVVVDGSLVFVASSKNPGSGSGSGSGSSTPSVSYKYWVLRTAQVLAVENFVYNYDAKTIEASAGDETISATSVSLAGGKQFTTSGTGYVYFITERTGLQFTCGGFDAGFERLTGTIPDTNLVVYKSKQIQKVNDLQISIK